MVSVFNAIALSDVLCKTDQEGVIHRFWVFLIHYITNVF